MLRSWTGDDFENLMYQMGLLFVRWPQIPKSQFHKCHVTNTLQDIPSVPYELYENLFSYFLMIQ